MNQRAPKAVNVWLDTSQEITPDVWPYLLREGLALTAWSPQDLAKAVGGNYGVYTSARCPRELTPPNKKSRHPGPNRTKGHPLKGEEPTGPPKDP